MHDGQACARTARELRTMKLHYYPEGGWGWVILFCASVSQSVSYGVQLAAGTLLANLVRRYDRNTPAATSASVAPPSNLMTQHLLKPFTPMEPAILARYKPIYHQSIGPSHSTPVAIPLAG